MSVDVKPIQEIDAALMPTVERIHRQLRPHLPQDYRSVLDRVLAGGAAVLVAIRDGEVLGLSIYRLNFTPRCDLRFYVDDLVVDERLRGKGIGSKLLRALEDVARSRGAEGIELESGISRDATHRFYEREGFERFAISFRKDV